mmetsp:Transcript_2141/g.6031  ORF Transcript_2141/g.6031 Transcript_2141/m.6031 type:complete len:211 (+) Transcript_2141:849-1481(+)
MASLSLSSAAFGFWSVPQYPFQSFRIRSVVHWVSIWIRSKKPFPSMVVAIRVMNMCVWMYVCMYVCVQYVQFIFLCFSHTKSFFFLLLLLPGRRGLVHRKFIVRTVFGLRLPFETTRCQILIGHHDALIVSLPRRNPNTLLYATKTATDANAVFEFQLQRIAGNAVVAVIVPSFRQNIMAHADRIELGTQLDLNQRSSTQVTQKTRTAVH